MVMLVFIFICVNKLLIVSRLSCLVHLSVPFFGRFYVEICRKKKEKKKAGKGCLNFNTLSLPQAKPKPERFPLNIFSLFPNDFM